MRMVAYMYRLYQRDDGLKQEWYDCWMYDFVSGCCSANVSRETITVLQFGSLYGKKIALMPQFHLSLIHILLWNYD